MRRMPSGWRSATHTRQILIKMAGRSTGSVRGRYR